MSTPIGVYNQKVAAATQNYRDAISKTKKNYEKHLEGHKEVDKKRRGENVLLFKQKLEEKERILRDKIKKVNEKSLYTLDKRNDQYNKKLEKFKRQVYEDRQKKRKEFNDQLERISDSFKESYKNNDSRQKEIRKEMQNRLENTIDRDRRDHHRDVEDFNNKAKKQQDHFTNQKRDLARIRKDREDKFLYQQEKINRERHVNHDRTLAGYKKAQQKRGRFIKRRSAQVHERQ